MFTFRTPLHKARVLLDEYFMLTAREPPSPADLLRMDEIRTSGPLLEWLTFSMERLRERRQEGLLLGQRARAVLLLRAWQLETGAYPPTLEEVLPPSETSGLDYKVLKDGRGFSLGCAAGKLESVSP